MSVSVAGNEFGLKLSMQFIEIYTYVNETHNNQN